MTPRCSLHHRTNHWESLIWHQPLMTRQTPLVRGRWLYLSSVQLDLILMPLHSTLVLSKATTYLSRVDLLPQHQVTYCFPNTSYLTVPPTPGYLLFPQTQVTVPPNPSYCSPNTKLLFPQHQVTVPPTPSYCSPNTKLLFPQHQVTVPPTPSYCSPNTKLLFPQHQVTYCSPNTKLLFPQHQVTCCSPNTKLLTVPPTPSFLLFPPDQVIFLQFPQQQLQFPHIKSLSKYRQPKIRLTN